MLARLALAGALVVALTPDAEACSCTGFDWFAPVNGAVDVPTNLASITYSGRAIQHVLLLTDDAGNEVELGGPVPLAGYLSSVFQVPVLASLLPSTRYVLTYTGYEGASTLSFTTASAADTTAPAPVTVTDLRAQYSEYGPNVSDSCGDRQGDLRGTIAGAEPGATLVVHITGTNFNETRTLAAGSGFRFSSQSCAVRLDVVPCADYQVDVWQVDLAGNVGPTAIHDVHVLGCPRMDSFDSPGCDGYTGPDVCMPYDEPTDPDDDGPPMQDDDEGGCSTGGGSPLALLGLLALRRRSRAASRTRSPRR